MADLVRLPLVGCFSITPVVHRDARGTLVKVFQASWLQANGLRSDFVEHFVSTSRSGVLRGLHFQAPPAEHAKLVTCLHGRIFDAFLDVRADSPTFGEHASVILDADVGNAVYLPAGLAHGFWTLSDEAMVSYHVTAEHVPELDRGVHWASAGILWPGSSPVVSSRDAALPDFASLRTPFATR